MFPSIKYGFIILVVLSMFVYVCMMFTESTQWNKQPENDIQEVIDVSYDGEMNISEHSTVTIGKAHKEGIPHRGVWMRLFRSSVLGGCEFLMVKRPLNAKTCPGSWTFPGEHTQHMEPYDTAALRFGITTSDVKRMIPLMGNGYPMRYRIEYPAPIDRIDEQWVVPYMILVNQHSRIRPSVEAIGTHWLHIDDVNISFWTHDCNGPQHHHKNSKLFDFCENCQTNAFTIYNPKSLLNNNTSFLNIQIEIIRDALRIIEQNNSICS